LSFAYIEEKDLARRYKDAVTYMEPLFIPLDEYERIARNKPHPGIAKELPKVTDGTLAALIQDQPKRIIQQIPTGKIKSKSPWLDIVGGFILTNEIIPNSDAVAALIQKCWALTSKSMTYGSQPAFVQFMNRGEYFGTDFTLPYIKDVMLEPGKLSDRDSNVIFLRAYYQPNQIDAIIAKETRLSDSAKKRGDKYESGWDVGALAKLKLQISEKPSTAQTPNERNKSNSPGYIQMIHCFQRGIGACFYSFDPTKDTDNVVRRKVNKDPRGAIPIHYMYANQDFSNPLGRGIIEISGGMQNLLDSETQMYQYMRALMVNPPIRKRGEYSKSTLKYAPGAIWDLGSNPANEAEAVELSTRSLEQFPTNAQMMRAQILNLNSGGGDTSVGADAVGSSASSKTPAGVKATESKLGASDNYFRRQFEAVYEEIIETEINLYFAERSGTQELTLDPETAAKLQQLNPTAVDDKNVIRIDYDTETEKLEFKADPTSSTEGDTQEQLASLGELLKETSADPLIAWRMSQDGFKMNMGEAYREYFQNMGIKNIDKIITEMSDQEKQQAQGGKMPMMDKPKITIGFDDLGNIPEAMQGALANAGIDLPIEVFQAAVQMKQQAEAAKNAQPTDPTAITPEVQLKAQAQQHAQAIAESKLAIEQQNADAKTGQAHVQAVDVAHQHHNALNAHLLATSAEALKIAQAQQSATQADKTHEFTVTQADRTHKLAEKQAKQPVKAGK
jgi:hypothetical protein